MTSTTSYGTADYITMPWKNGGGTTTELARDTAEEDYGWRLSIADIAAAGPFSRFAGQQRIITVLEGSGMNLVVEGRSSGDLTPFIPFAFDGGAVTECALLAGPVRDFNLMYRKDAYTARFEWLILPVMRSFLTTAPTVLIFNAGAVVEVQSAHFPARTVAKDGLLRIDNPAGPIDIAVNGDGSGACAVIELWQF